MHKVALAMVAAVLLATVALAQAPAREPVREGNIERLVLDDGADVDAAAWTPAEATVNVDKKHVKHGDTALRFHVDVNWSTGEKAYPIGWPRMNRKWPEAVQDWSQYDFFEFSVFVESSRKTLPKTPMGMTLYDQTGKKNYSRSLTDLQLGQWTDYRIPVAELKRSLPCTGMQVHISESEYKDGDVLDFWIDNISLTRYLQPTLTASTLPEQTITSASRYLMADLNLMGVKPGQSAAVTWQAAISGEGTAPRKIAATGKLTAQAGKQRYYLTLPSQGLLPGAYEVTFKTGTEGPKPFSLIVVPSPWQEGSK